MSIAQTLESTKLTFKPDEDPSEVIHALCQDAIAYQMRGVCIPPDWVQAAKKWLSGTDLKVITVVGFPFDKRNLAAEQSHPTIGSVPTSEKLSTIEAARQAGADELDIVLNVAEFKASQDIEELDALKNAAGLTPIKLIIETDLLTPEEISWAAHLCCKAQIAFVKTSTGMLEGGQGATVANIETIKEAIESYPKVIKPQIKASGGIRDLVKAKALLEAGADVLGTSSGVELCQSAGLEPLPQTFSTLG